MSGSETLDMATEPHGEVCGDHMRCFVTVGRALVRIETKIDLLIAQQQHATAMSVSVQGSQSSGGATMTMTSGDSASGSKVQWGYVVAVVAGAIAILGAIVPGASHGAIDILKGLLQ